MNRNLKHGALVAAVLAVTSIGSACGAPQSESAGVDSPAAEAAANTQMASLRIEGMT